MYNIVPFVSFILVYFFLDIGHFDFPYGSVQIVMKVLCRDIVQYLTYSSTNSLRCDLISYLFEWYFMCMSTAIKRS